MHMSRSTSGNTQHAAHHAVTHVHRFDAPSFAPPTSREHEAARLREVYELAEAHGHAAGHEAGMLAARAEIDALAMQHREAIARAADVTAALAEAAHRLDLADRLALGDMERSVVELALELASEIVGREVLLDGAAMDAVRTAAAFAPERQPMEVRVHPRDVEAVRDELFMLDLPIGSSVMADPTVGRGQCVLDVGGCRIDHQVAGALTRMRAAVADFYGDAHTVRSEIRDTREVAA